MNAPTTFDFDEMRAEISEIDLVSASADAGRSRTGLVRRFDDLPLARKIVLLGGAPLVAIAAISLVAWSALPVDATVARWTILGLAVATIVLGIAAIRMTLRNTSGQLAKLAEDMGALANGQRDFTLTGLERRDEIGKLARAFEIFLKSGYKLDEMFSTRRKDRERREKEVRTFTRSFESSVSDVVAGVGAASVQLRSTATSMAETAEQSSAQVARVAQAMEEASAGVTAAAAASDEFAMSIGEISRQAAQSAELARQATDSTQEADTTISALSTTAEQIGHVVELISTIAKRTNLLALNASIEAARGGEAGRGFAVVASEVKELASQTGRATEQVAQQIKAIQETTVASVGALRAVADQVQQLEATAVSIASAVDQQSVAGQELARNIDLAARGTHEVKSNVLQVRETATSTGAAATQVLASATELETQAATLRGQVDRILRVIRTRD